MAFVKVATKEYMDSSRTRDMNCRPRACSRERRLMAGWQRRKWEERYMAGFVRGILLALCFMVTIGVLGTFWRGMAPRERGDSFGTWEGWLCSRPASI